MIMRYTITLYLARISCTIPICISLVWVCNTWAVVATIRNAIPISVYIIIRAQAYIAAIRNAIPICV